MQSHSFCFPGPPKFCAGLPLSRSTGSGQTFFFKQKNVDIYFLESENIKEKNVDILMDKNIDETNVDILMDITNV